MKELTNEWIDKMAKEMGLSVCYVEVGKRGCELSKLR
jgi:hypothetical protein